MRKKISWLIISLSIIIIFGLVFLIFEKYESIQVKKENEKTMSKIILDKMDGSKIDLQNLTNQPSIIFFFNTDCEHCQNEAEEIIKYKNSFKNRNVLWLSIEPIENLLKFEEKYKIQETILSLKIAKISITDFNKHFSISTNPTILIYKDKKLVRKFVGETKIEVILKYL
jgi:peroxiredoxin